MLSGGGREQSTRSETRLRALPLLQPRAPPLWHGHFWANLCCLNLIVDDIDNDCCPCRKVGMRRQAGCG